MYTCTNTCMYNILSSLVPVCSLEEAVSVVCIDLKYSVDMYPTKEKDEKTDTITVSLFWTIIFMNLRMK